MAFGKCLLAGAGQEPEPVHAQVLHKELCREFLVISNQKNLPT